MPNMRTILVLVAAMAAVHAIPLNDATEAIARAPNGIAELEMRDIIPTPVLRRQTGSTGAPGWKRQGSTGAPGWKRQGSTGAPPWRREAEPTDDTPTWKRTVATTADAPEWKRTQPTAAVAR